ncbi:twin-arginine translocase TatA/TatE family subunit [Ornithinimicrobium panacihumi]|uniref:twin-arginine translocase TatA/TatE family subunit n=1 Tax=Ornithinimicrobium panacihumi TaxID=2008449 RepID=UPI003F8959DA
MLNIQGEEVILLVILAFLILGPKRLPYYAGKLGEAVRSLRSMAEGAKTQIKDELGPSFDDVDWRQLDPRQYDPRRIVREALTSPGAGSAAAATASASAGGGATAAAASVARSAAPPSPWGSAAHDPSLPTPFDTDAT